MGVGTEVVWKAGRPSQERGFVRLGYGVAHPVNESVVEKLRSS